MTKAVAAFLLGILLGPGVNWLFTIVAFLIGILLGYHLK